LDVIIRFHISAYENCSTGSKLKGKQLHTHTHTRARARAHTHTLTCTRARTHMDAQVVLNVSNREDNSY